LRAQTRQHQLFLFSRISRLLFVSLDLFGRCAGHLRRIAETLGLRRVPLQVPTLAEHLAKLEREQAAAADEEAGAA
jgi:hypothetical protein